MFVFAQEDLNTKTGAKASSAASSAGSNAIGNLPFGQFDFNPLLSNLNVFLLGWTIFYTFVLLIDFFEYRVLHVENAMVKERKGMKGIYRAMKVSRNYLFFWVVYLLYGIFGSNSSAFQLPLGIAVILAFILKIIVDLKVILDLLEWQPFGKSISKALKKLLTLGK